MIRLGKISLKTVVFASTTLALFCAVTWKTNAGNIVVEEIYSTLTTDTIKPKRKDTTTRKPGTTSNNVANEQVENNATSIAVDTVPDRSDTLPQVTTDTFALKLSKDTLDAPVNYEAEDSAVVLIQDKIIILYGKTKTTYKDVTLTAPKVEIDQQTNIVTAVNEKDSIGNVITRARFSQGADEFESDTIRFNFKTQQGLTRNTFTQQDEMFVQGETIKKINANTFFVSHGRFTTCNLDEPHFAFHANKLKVINNKVAVSGPAHPEFEGVPVPIYLPFGYYPLSRGRHSGLLPPTFTATEDFGLGLEGLGYYHVLNDNFDVTLRGNIYSYGGWSANVTPTYRKRYRYNGSMNFSIQHTKFNFKGDPDYQKHKTFSLSWSHSVDQRARPGTNFSASVNASSSKYNRYYTNNPNRNFQNHQASSISYSKSWAGKPYNLSISANHNQNNAIHLINFILPDAGFTVNTIYPFQKKEAVGSPKWYEKLGIGYNGTVRNQLSFYDTAAIVLRNLLDTLQWGAQHRVPLSLSLPSLGPILVSPSIYYEEKWLNSKFRRQWNDTANKQDIFIQKGLYTDRQLTFGVGMNTAVYGTLQFKRSRMQAIRHVMRPSVSFNYKPDLSKSHFYSAKVDSTGREVRFSEFEGTLFSGYPEGKFGGISFGIDNNLEMKWRSKKDTGVNAIKKVRLIDGFGFNSNYNFLSDSLKLGDFNLYLRSTLFEKINLTAQAVLSPYDVDDFGQRINRFVWHDGTFRVGRFSGASLSMSTDFKSKPRDPSKAPVQQNVLPMTDDPLLANDQQQLLDYMRRNPAEFVDFNIPWSINLNLSVYYTKQRSFDGTGIINDFSANISFNNSFSLTPKWNFTTNGYYDLDTRKLQTFTFSINREMHCWQMSISATPVGPYSYFNISISPKSSILQDLRINRTRTFTNY